MPWNPVDYIYRDRGSAKFLKKIDLIHNNSFRMIDGEVPDDIANLVLEWRGQRSV